MRRLFSRDCALAPQLRIFVQDWDVDPNLYPLVPADGIRAAGGTGNPDFFTSVASVALNATAVCGSFAPFAAKRAGANSAQESVVAKVCERALGGR